MKKLLLALLICGFSYATPLHFASDSIDVNNIYSNPAGSLVIDTVNKAIYDSAFNLSIDLENRRTVTASGLTGISWRDAVAVGPNDGQQAMNWDIRVLYDAFENVGLNWTLRWLVDQIGITQLIWGTSGINYPNLTASTLLALNGSKYAVSASVTSPLTFAASALGCQAASGSQAGCLAAADWTTFNNKAPTSAPTFSTSANFSYATISTPAVFDGSKNLISGSVSAPITLTSGAFGCQASSGSQAGCLSSADWTTFNGKQGVATVNTISSNTTLACNTINFIDTTSARSETFPSPTSGCVIEIKDKSFNANTNNITFVRAASEKIENVAASYVFSSNGGAIKWVSNGTDWFRL